jgi:glucose-6-phosphate 1-dehydrogenase
MMTGTDLKHEALADEAPIGLPHDPCVIVIFGGSGDLTKRKLVPALYNLAKEKLLPDEFAIVAVARSEMNDAEFRARMNEDIRQYATSEVDPELWRWFDERIHYIGGAFDDVSLYARLKALLGEIDARRATKGNYLYYLAVSPDHFGLIVQQLGAVGLTQQELGSYRRVIVEKPFGRDLESAKALNSELRKTLEEQQIYRIDHYLGKETVQNILVFRFGNGIFEPVWNRRYVDHVQITVSETLGVEGRGGYFERAGTLRDMVPNHVFQLISLVAMEPPISFAADAVRDEQSKILRAVQPMSPEEVLNRTVRGQYGEGTLADERVIGYRQEANVSPQSSIETFVAMKLTIDNWRWADVPFYLRVGKRLHQRVTEIAIHFKRAPFILFRNTPIEKLAPNLLLIRIQPDEGISLRFGAKIPGAVLSLGTVNMDFRYSDYFGSRPATGYERLLYDAMAGDATLFQRADMVESGWSVVTPVLDVWEALRARNFPNYAAGSWGPKEAEQLLEKDGRSWRRIGGHSIRG